MEVGAGYFVNILQYKIYYLPLQSQVGGNIYPLTQD